jgi:hypothetical protein
MTKDILVLTADDILAIPANKPELLFAAEFDVTKLEYRRLVSIWHPDQNPMVDENVMTHINVLYNLAVLRFSTDSWVTPGVIVFKTDDGKKFQLKYKSTCSFELGDIYIGDTVVAYSLFKDNEDLYKNARNIIRNFKFADDKMREEVKHLLPEIHSELVTEDRLVMLIKKTPDQLLMSDVLNHFNGEVDPKHVAWMISRLYNICCYLKYANLVHAGITPDACLISPEFHTVSLLGGWWYAGEKGRKLQALPGVAVEFAPDDVINAEVLDPRIDLELLRATGRQMLGDIIGSKLLMNKNIPPPLVTWLREPSKGDAYDEYKTWHTKTVIDAFGPRRFVELKLSADDLYGNKA